jgi:hypothetical protein
MTGAGDGIRTRDIDLGKVALYQLSYSRLKRNLHFHLNAATCQTHGSVRRRLRLREMIPVIRVCPVDLGPRHLQFRKPPLDEVILGAKNRAA